MTTIFAIMLKPANANFCLEQTALYETLKTKTAKKTIFLYSQTYAFAEVMFLLTKIMKLSTVPFFSKYFNVI